VLLITGATGRLSLSINMPNIRFGSAEWISLLEDAASIKGVKKGFSGSGIRYELFMKEPDSRSLLKNW
jgi:hypothetical protein